MLDRDAIVEILASSPSIAAAWLFGSFARGEAGPGSDLDLGIIFVDDGVPADARWRELLDLASRLEAVHRPVDLVLLDEVGWALRHHVLAEGQLIYEADRERRVAWHAAALSRYLDFQPTLRLATRGKVAAFRRWASEQP